MRGPDAAGGEDIGVAGAQRIERGDDLVLLVGNDAHFLQVDADGRHDIGEVADVAVFRAARKDLVADDHHGGGDDLGHGFLRKKGGHRPILPQLNRGNGAGSVNNPCCIRRLPMNDGSPRYRATAHPAPTGLHLKETTMAKVLVLYYSSFGHMEQMAKAAAEGARAAGADVTLKRVPELVPEAVAKASHYKLDQQAEIATPAELESYDAIIIGSATRYGAVASQMKNFLDQTGPLWARGALLDKVGSVMVSTATQHGGAELALLSTQATLQHHGMIIVPLSYAYQGQMGNDVVRGGAPYGMTTTADGDGSRQPSAQELEGAHFQGKRVAEIAIKLHG